MLKQARLLPRLSSHANDISQHEQAADSTMSACKLRSRNDPRDRLGVVGDASSDSMASSNIKSPVAQLHGDCSSLENLEDDKIETIEVDVPGADPISRAKVSYEDITDRSAARRATKTNCEKVTAVKRTPDEDFSQVASKRINSNRSQQSVARAAAHTHRDLEAKKAPPQLDPAPQDDLFSREHRGLPGLSPTSATMALPARKLFAVQMGDRLFRLSGASISSDAPSYLSQFFEEQMKNNPGAESCRPLYIDRDPATFGDILLHLQGYHVEPRDGSHLVKLFADAQFFSLPRLTAQLFSSTIYVRVGEQEFGIPKALFNSPGDSPNYFSLGFSNFFTTTNDRFPGLSQRELLRPPSLLPPSVPTRSATVFADLLHLLKGYHIHIRNEHHRQQLLRDARYYHFKGLEQRLIAHRIAYNVGRHKTEILLGLEDIKPSGLTVVLFDVDAFTPSPSPGSISRSDVFPSSGSVYYQRPYVDMEAYELVIEIGEDASTMLEVKPACTETAAFRLAHATLHNQTLTNFNRLVAAVSDKMGLSRAQSTDAMNVDDIGTGTCSSNGSRSASAIDRKIPVRIGPETHIVLDGRAWTPNLIASGGPNADDSWATSPSAGLREQYRGEGSAPGTAEWVVGKSQWRLTVQSVHSTRQLDKVEAEVVLEAVKMEAFSSERRRNAAKGFLV